MLYTVRQFFRRLIFGSKYYTKRIFKKNNEMRYTLPVVRFLAQQIVTTIIGFKMSSVFLYVINMHV